MNPLKASLVFAALFTLAGCGAPPQAIAPPDAQPHLGETWFSHRAQTLEITVEAARARDAALTDETPPADHLDAHTAREAAVIWSTVCARCHGLDGTPPAEMVTQWEAAGQSPPRSWGGSTRMGFAMGGASMRAGLFRKIRDGVPPVMPPWGASMSQEQIWALVRHLEGF